ncbi:tRNA epoxyqueuosine(34) reductase QueG [Sphingorhabdus sp. YGSMI21]|uniref:tRNA epoxyqueuosine(34) reductase QueG n=1 Tax=Sphingorhabdus sp. YGSMI21 TaxID=2077182 RepID=UPI000C1EC895|nr:tRNA epoxyqueuosine(34) reductase QueG [Sphingorhabdus sp. YGSMI21]ATW02528.1 tRNA epoxyqueuosine(34) reductase QueG [Sphingorhabdus sp. YGSMI21]
MPDDKLRLTKALENRAKDEGFAAVGIAPARLAPETGLRLQQWLDEGRQGDMLWMVNRADERSDPATLWPDVQTVVMLGMSYAPAVDPFALEPVSDHGRISVYAQGRDYHDVVKSALKRTARWLVEQAECEVKVFVDTAPVMEKPLAEAAGLGWQGKHTNVVSREHGSWLFLGAIYTTLDLEPSKPGRDSCGSCSACQDICPTGAFPAPYQLDARACISYLTIEHKGPIPHKYRKAIGNHIYGCDDCLAVCPWNKFAKAGAANKAFLPRAELAAPALVDILALDDAGFRQVFSGSPIKRTGRDRMVRNALIAAGNSGDTALIQPVQALLEDEDDVIREAAGWALDQLASAQP